MNSKSIFVSAIFLLQTHVFSQIVISDTPKDPHPNALLEIDSDKGVLLPSVNNFTELPLYTTNESDFFLDDPSMEGMLVYNKEDHTLYKYDGYTWMPSYVKSFKNNENSTLLTSTYGDIVKLNILNISTTDIVPFNQVQTIYGKPINNANIEFVDEDNDSIYESYRFTETGWYIINPSITVASGGGLSVGNLDVNVILKAKFANENNDKWWAIMQIDYSLQGLLVSVNGGEKAVNASIMKKFYAGDIIRFEIGLRNPDGLTVGSGVTYKCTSPNSFLFIHKL